MEGSGGVDLKATGRPILEVTLTGRISTALVHSGGLSIVDPFIVPIMATLVPLILIDSFPMKFLWTSVYIDRLIDRVRRGLLVALEDTSLGRGNFTI